MIEEQRTILVLSPQQFADYKALGVRLEGDNYDEYVTAITGELFDPNHLTSAVPLPTAGHKLICELLPQTLNSERTEAFWFYRHQMVRHNIAALARGSAEAFGEMDTTNTD